MDHLLALEVSAVATLITPPLLLQLQFHHMEDQAVEEQQLQFHLMVDHRDHLQAHHLAYQAEIHTDHPLQHLYRQDLAQAVALIVVHQAVALLPPEVVALMDLPPLHPHPHLMEALQAQALLEILTVALHLAVLGHRPVATHMDHLLFLPHHHLLIVAHQDLVQLQTPIVVHLVVARHQLEAVAPMDLHLPLQLQYRRTEVDQAVDQLPPHRLMEVHQVHHQAQVHIVGQHLQLVHLLVTPIHLQQQQHHPHLTAARQDLAQAQAATQIHMEAHLVAVVQVILTIVHLPRTMSRYITPKATKNVKL